MSSNGPAKIISIENRTAQVGRPAATPTPSHQARVLQVAAALAADPLNPDALAAGGRSSEAMGPAVRTADPTYLGARRAALAAALQAWSGATNTTLRTTALAVLAASRTARLRQEATRESPGLAQESVFEAFVRGAESDPGPVLLAARGARQ